MCFGFIPKMAWMASSWTCALMDVHSLQPNKKAFQEIRSQHYTLQSFSTTTMKFPTSFCSTIVVYLLFVKQILSISQHGHERKVMSYNFVGLWGMKTSTLHVVVLFICNKNKMFLCIEGLRAMLWHENSKRPTSSTSYAKSSKNMFSFFKALGLELLKGLRFENFYGLRFLR